MERRGVEKREGERRSKVRRVEKRIKERGDRREHGSRNEEFL